MAFIIGEDRYQSNLLPNTLDDYIGDDNPVRVIDAYVDSLDLEEIGFKVLSGHKAGQKPYLREDLLKISLYCYTNKIRSSRKMEIETTRNVELMWLVGKLTPDHGTLSLFIKDNKKAIVKLFKEFTLMLKGFGLIDGELIAIDGTKIKASSAKNKHFNNNIINIKVKYYETKIEEYLNSFIESSESKQEKISIKLDECKEKIEKLAAMKTELKKEGKTQICLTDPDSKSMKNNGKFEVCYNLQTAVDSRHKFIIAYDVVNDCNDCGQLSNMISKARENFEKGSPLTFVADTGYFNKLQITESVNENTEILIKKQNSKKERVKAGFDITNFKYDNDKNVYVCPMGYLLTFKHKCTKGKDKYKKYECKDYDKCGKKDLCTKAKFGRGLSRYLEEEIIEFVEKNTIIKNAVYKKRGTIVEHPFGTIKRHYGYSYFTRRGFASVNAEGGLICLAYNIKRLINVIGVKDLVAHFRAMSRLKACYNLKIMNLTILHDF